MDDESSKAVQHPLQPVSRLYADKIIRQRLALYNKKLDEGQMNQLLQNAGSTVPLWLTLACEELRVFGMIADRIVPACIERRQACLRR